MERKVKKAKKVREEETNMEERNYRLEAIERDIKELKEKVKPVLELQFGFNSLTEAVNKLSKQFEEFSKLNNSRTYDWLKYLATLLIGAAVTFLIKG